MARFILKWRYIKSGACVDPIDRLEDSLNEIIPDSPNKPYDMYEVIGAIVDNGEFLEVQKDYAKNIIIGF